MGWRSVGWGWRSGVGGRRRGPHLNPFKLLPLLTKPPTLAKPLPLLTKRGHAVFCGVGGRLQDTPRHPSKPLPQLSEPLPLLTKPLQFSVGFEGDFGAHLVTPRTLNSSHVNKLVCINGIITKCSLVRPKILKSVHFCEDTKSFHNKVSLNRALTEP